MRTCAYLTAGKNRLLAPPTFTEARIVVISHPNESICGKGCKLASEWCSRLRRPQTLGESPIAATLKKENGLTEAQWRKELEGVPCKPEFESYS